MRLIAMMGNDRKLLDVLKKSGENDLMSVSGKCRFLRSIKNI